MVLVRLQLVLLVRAPARNLGSAGTVPRMRYIEVNGIRVSSIGLGTWQFGSKEWGYGAAYARDEAGKIAARALELGINLIDTAEIYGRNESERIVGRAIAGH